MFNRERIRNDFFFLVLELHNILLGSTGPNYAKCVAILLLSAL